ncbi:MAG: hypothetical protein AB1899_14535 [Pseudomonadota bacterium]
MNPQQEAAGRVDARFGNPSDPAASSNAPSEGGAAGAAGRLAGQMAEQARERARQALGSTTAAIREEPFRAILIAAVVGAALAMLFKRCGRGG